MIKYACYTRVSTNKEEQASSLKSQKVLFEKYIEKNNGKLFKIYQDIESGTNSNRSGLNELIEDAKNHKFDAILIKEWSRLSRNASDSHTLRNLFLELNIQIIDITTGNNLLKEDTLMFSIYSAYAQKESERISDRTKQGKIAGYYKGQFKGSRPPYGYKKIDTALVIRDDDTPNIVRSIFKMYLDGFGSDRIAKYLNKNNFPTPAQIVDWKNANSLWHGSTIDKILRNQAYIGHVVQHKTTTMFVTSNKREILPPSEYIIVKNRHKAIISEEEFNKVQDMIKLRHKERRKAQVHLFSNFLYCSHCGRRLHYKANRKGYVCAGYNRHGKDVCSSHFIKEEDLEKIILGDLRCLLSKINHKKILNKLKKQISLNHNNLESDISKINQKLKKLEVRKSNARMQLLDEIFTVEEYKKTCTDIDTDIKKLNDKKVTLLKSSNNDFLDEIMNELNTLSKNIVDIVQLNNKTMSELINKIVISENGEPSIYYKFSAHINYIDKLLLLD
ncbi:recombinase family protein [Clostridioides sp. ZZV15-6597]|uniref:recombinase family protein n=1 Tax=Clostridioides sp. ZZV15-6597 TaxID=2811500 RepID=UPI001D0F9133|nr:recombinase family protein [Clostridioides sp. ZZV15-6597]